MFNGGVTFFNLRCWLVVVCLYFLADRTSSRAYATVLRLSVVCNVCIVAKRCVLPKNCLKKQIEKGLGVIEWSRDVTSHVTIRFPSRKITKNHSLHFALCHSRAMHASIGRPKKVSCKFLPISSPNIYRFSKIFHRHILWKICNKIKIYHQYA